ncbi:MAG: hypothetical protein FJ302_13690 [Planctomycetes bacterium]|nr:hypothetical protein [Planctomycetota bacterium]
MSTAPEMEQLTARLDELQRRTAGLTAALAGSRNSRRMIMLAFVAFVFVALMGFYSLANRIQSAEYQQRLVAELQKSVASNQDTFASEAQKLVEGAAPVIQTAFSEQASKDMPLFMQVIDAQRTEMVNSLVEQMTKKLEGHHHDLVRRHEKLFQQEFPTVQNAEVRERMVGNICLAFDRLVKKYYVDGFIRELKSMETAWEEFPLADQPAEGEASLEEQLKGSLMDLFAITVSRSRNAPVPGN